MLMLKTIAILKVSANHIHDFSCGVEELDLYLKRYAKANHKNRIGKTFVYENENRVVGFYTISMASIEYKLIPEKYRVKLPKYPIPAARIGRLAVDKYYQGQKIGQLLLIDALYRIYKLSEQIGTFAVIVDAKDNHAKNFYLRFGFIPYEDRPLSLFLPIKSIQSLFEHDDT